MTGRVLALERPNGLEAAADDGNAVPIEFRGTCPREPFETVENQSPPPPPPGTSTVAALEQELRNALADYARFPEAEDPLRLLLEEGVGSLARHVGMSARSLRRHCANAGLPLARRRKDLRADEVRRLLAMDLPVATIAQRLGFSSSQTLARFLKQRFGRTATQLRRSVGSGETGQPLDARRSRP